eukprot:s1094_g18.t1
MQKHLSSLEDVMRTLQERMASGLELESSPRAAMTEVQELMALSESRLMQRTKSEVETLRLQLADLRALLNDGLDLRTAAAADLERRMLAAEKSATLLRSELNTTRMQAEETANREARLTGEVRAFTEKLSICQADVKEADAKVAGQLAEVARLQQSVLICQQQQRASQQLTQVSQLSAGSTTTVEPLSPEHRYTGQNAVLLRRIQDRLQRVEDSRDQFQLHLEERIRQLENTSNAAEMRSSSSATLMVSAVRSSVGPQLDEVKTRLDRHEETLRSLQLQISGRAIHQPTRVEPVTTRAQAESPESPSRERFDARLSRLEDLFDQLPTTQSVESSGLELSSLPASTAPPNSTMMLTLNWVDEHSESASSENIRSALREVPVNLVRVDTLPEGRGALGAQGRETVCWLASTDTPAAETALRRQLTDPSSALRRLLPGLVAESSAVVPAPLAALAVGHARQLSARVNNLEDAQRQLADNLTSVERQVLSMEGRLAGSLGLTAPLQRRGDPRTAGGQSESSPLNLSSIGPPGHGRRDPVGSGRSPSDRIDVDEDDASVDFDSAFNETAEASRRKEEQRHAAEQAAQVERERRRAEEEFERKRQEQADAERRRADAARKEREEAEEKRREEMRRLEEEAAKRQAEQAKRAREQAAEDARLQEEAEAARRLRLAEASGLTALPNSFEDKAMALSETPLQLPFCDGTAFLVSRPRLGCFTWNCSGLSIELLMELFTWLRSRPDISIIVLQETHWGFTNDWVQDEWRFCHSGMSKGKQGGVLVGVRKDKVKPEDISWTELEPGRLLHWRCAYGKQQLDVVAVYQHALSHRTEEQRAKLMQQRKSLWNKLDKVLASLPFRTSIILAGDFNAVLNPSAGLTTGAGIHAGPKQSGIAEDRALLMRQDVQTHYRLKGGAVQDMRLFTLVDSIIHDMWRSHADLMRSRPRQPGQANASTRQRILEWRNTPEAKEHHKRMRRLARQRKRDQLLNVLQEAEAAAQSKDSRKLYQHIRLLAPKSYRRRVCLRDEQGSLMTSQEECEALKEYALQLFNGPDFALPTLMPLPVHWFTPEAWQSALAKLATHKAVPSQCASIAGWKEHTSHASTILHEVAKMTVAHSEPSLPTEWSQVQLAWLPKPNKSTASPAGLRTIGLMGADTKAFIHILKQKANVYVQQALQDSPQYAYRKHTSTLNALLRASEHIVETCGMCSRGRLMTLHPEFFSSLCAHSSGA